MFKLVALFRIKGSAPRVACLLAASVACALYSSQGRAQDAAPVRTETASPVPAGTVPPPTVPTGTVLTPAPVPVPVGGITVLKAESATPVHTDLPSDLSVTGMFQAADPIVKGVMGLLAAASVATWAIFLYKFIELSAARSRARSDLKRVARSGSLDQVVAAVSKGPVARLAQAAELEIAASEQLAPSGVKERVAIALQRIESSSARRVGVGTGVLASVGSTGPFVGLFGTVWGIMHSFIHISNTHTTNLAVVAPGIAEALLATAMGLVAAIPAVVIYNIFSRWIAAYRQLLGDASAGIMRHVSRDLDRAEAGVPLPITAA